MSFQDAEPHAAKALSFIQAGNATKAMHHIGHALNHLRSMTIMASGNPKTPLAMPAAQSKSAVPSGVDGADEPAAGSLRARLAGAGAQRGSQTTSMPGPKGF